MNTSHFIQINEVTALPSFHDAELISIEHDPDAKSLTLLFKRVSGPIETLRFLGVVAHRMIDFTDQNVASRLLISPIHRFSVDDLHTWVRWIYSRDDAKAPELDRTIINAFFQDVIERRKVLFVLEPSCGAELAVLCESVSIRMK